MNKNPDWDKPTDRQEYFDLSAKNPDLLSQKQKSFVNSMRFQEEMFCALFYGEV